MIYVTIILILLITIFIIKIGLDVKIKDIKEIKELNQDQDLIAISDKFPSNEEICKETLKVLKNENVIIENNDNSQTSLYMVMQNKIIIGSINKTFARIQTVIHECIHSIQNKKILKFNFIFSNINILFYVIICLVALIKKLNQECEVILLLILILFQLVIYMVRAFLETDAMTRAEYMSIEYIKKFNKIKQQEKDKIIESYKKLNNIGIKFYNFTIAFQSILKIIIFCIILLI